MREKHNKKNVNEDEEGERALKGGGKQREICKIWGKHPSFKEFLLPLPLSLTCKKNRTNFFPLFSPSCFEWTFLTGLRVEGANCFILFYILLGFGLHYKRMLDGYFYLGECQHRNRLNIFMINKAWNLLSETVRKFVIKKYEEWARNKLLSPIIPVFSVEYLFF